MSEVRLHDFTTLTFDVVGTLIDFEEGILQWFRPILARRHADKTDEQILTTFALCEDKWQQDAPNESFTAILSLIYRDMMDQWKMTPNDNEAREFRESIQSWPAFPDTIASLRELKKRYRLVAVTQAFRWTTEPVSSNGNADSWALKYMSATMGNPFDAQVTCDEVGTNKPSPRVFEYVLQKLAPFGIEKRHTRSVHTAQSQYHDIVPAAALGFATMWIERRHGQPSYGATPEPDYVATPTFHATSMTDFVRQVQQE